MNVQQKRRTYLWFELERLPDELHLLAPVVLLHDGEAESELRHGPSVAHTCNREMIIELKIYYRTEI